MGFLKVEKAAFVNLLQVLSVNSYVYFFVTLISGFIVLATCTSREMCVSKSSEVLDQTVM